MNQFRLPALAGPALLLAAAILLSLTPTSSEAATPASKSSLAATRKVIGYALDELGRPVDGATVCLTRELISEDECEDSLVIAQTRSQSQGRFELTALEADVKKALADPPAIFEIWVHKAGLALGHRFIFGEPSQEPQILSMRKESPTTICVHKPDGSLCNDASIAPIYVWLPLGHWSRLVPKPIQDQLKTRSMTDGRVTVAGLTDQLAIVAIETTQFGRQQVVIPPQQDSPTAVTLRETRTVEGRLVLRNGEKVDLSKLIVRIREVSAERSPDAKVTQGREQGAAPPLGTRYARFIVRPDRDGRFSIAKFPKFKHGRLGVQVSGPDEIPFTMIRMIAWCRSKVRQIGRQRSTFPSARGVGSRESCEMLEPSDRWPESRSGWLPPRKLRCRMSRTKMDVFASVFAPGPGTTWNAVCRTAIFAPFRVARTTW